LFSGSCPFCVSNLYSGDSAFGERQNQRELRFCRGQPGNACIDSRWTKQRQSGVRAGATHRKKSSARGDRSGIGTRLFHRASGRIAAGSSRASHHSGKERGPGMVDVIAASASNCDCCKLRCLLDRRENLSPGASCAHELASPLNSSLAHPVRVEDKSV
jgi:hypothetical protein